MKSSRLKYFRHLWRLDRKHFLLALTALSSRWIGAVDASRLLLGTLEVTRDSQQVHLLC